MPGVAMGAREDRVSESSRCHRAERGRAFTGFTAKPGA